MAKDSKNKDKKVNDKKKVTKLTREDKLANALQRNIKLRKENKKTVDR